NPDDVRVELLSNRRSRTLEVHVHPDDLGKVIGRGGRTATALRTVMSGIGGRGVRGGVVDTDHLPPRWVSVSGGASRDTASVAEWLSWRLPAPPPRASPRGGSCPHR